MLLELHNLMILLDEIEIILIAEDIPIAFVLGLAHSSLGLIIFIGVK